MLSFTAPLNLVVAGLLGGSLVVAVASSTPGSAEVDAQLPPASSGAQAAVADTARFSDDFRDAASAWSFHGSSTGHSATSQDLQLVQQLIDDLDREFGAFDAVFVDAVKNLATVREARGEFHVIEPGVAVEPAPAALLSWVYARDGVVRQQDMLRGEDPVLDAAFDDLQRCRQRSAALVEELIVALMD